MTATTPGRSSTLTLSEIVVEPVVAFDRRRVDWLLGIFAAGFVGAPVALALGTNLVIPGILLALGALNLFLGQGILAQPTRLQVGGLACGLNAAAFAVGLAVAASGNWEVPLIAVAIVGLQCALFLPRARSVALSSTALFAIAIGFPRVSASSALEYTGLILLGGAWGLLGSYTQWRLEVAMGARARSRGGRLVVTEPVAPTELPPIDHRIALGLAVTLGVASALAFSLAVVAGIPRDYWAILTVAVVLQAGLVATLSMAVVRIGGTAVGAAIGGAVAIVVTGPWALGLLIAALAGATLAFRNANRAIYVLFLTPFVLVLLSIGYPSGWSVAAARVYDTLLGGAVALCAAGGMWLALKATVLADRKIPV